VLILLGLNLARAVEFMDPDEIRVGMKGIGKSVFRGTSIEEFQVEVLGVMKKAYAANDMILVRCSGANLEHTGVIAGMSGSPVYIDGRLIGAVSMTYGFQKDPIAEITPIRAMADIMNRTDLPDQSGGDGGSRNRAAGIGEKGTLRPIPCPVTVSGLDDRLCRAFTSQFEPYGLHLMAGGAEVAPNPERRATGEELQPGAAIGVCLVRGDMNASAIGTLTYREGNRVVAFGHPMFLGGAILMPMVGGVIHAIMASTELSFKIFSPTAPVGAITQDRAAGIAGTIGPRVPMIPVRVRIRSDGRETEYNYELLDHKLITANLLGLVIANSLVSREQGAFDFTARADIAMKLRGYPVIHNQRWFGGEAVLYAATQEISGPLEYLMTNDFEKVEVERVDVSMDVTPGRQTLRIHRVAADRERAKPGDNLRLTVALDAFRGPGRTEVIDLTIPEETPNGVLKILVTTPDSALMVAPDLAGEKIMPRSVRQMIKLIEEIGRENQIIVQGYVNKKGAVIAGERFPNLPPSMLSLLDGSRATGDAGRTDASLLFEKRKDLDRIVTGVHVVEINIER
jgi:hypothetical protein